MKFCSTHGMKHQIDITSVLCCHPKCIRELVLSFSKKSNAIYKLWLIIKDHQSLSDMINYIVERLLVEKSEGKPLVINNTWLFFTLNRFVRDEMIQIAIEDELQTITEEVTESSVGWYRRSNNVTPESIMLSYDLIDWLIKEYSENYALYYTGYLNKSDLLKLEDISVRKLQTTLKDIKEARKKIEEI
jgi:hypothetical protein